MLLKAAWFLVRISIPDIIKFHLASALTLTVKAVVVAVTHGLVALGFGGSDTGHTGADVEGACLEVFVLSGRPLLMSLSEEALEEPGTSLLVTFGPSS